MFEKTENKTKKEAGEGPFCIVELRIGKRTYSRQLDLLKSGFLFQDWELGAFTPKTALPDNVVDAWHKSNLMSRYDGRYKETAVSGPS